MLALLQSTGESTHAANDVRNNIWKLYLLEIAYEGLFIIPVLIPFFQANHVSLKEVFWLQAAFAIAAFLSDIPTGYLADKWGRKNTLVIGGVFGLLGILAHALSTGFWGFFIGELLLALLVSFHSGTVEALLYDTLLDSDDSRDYRRLSGSMSFWGFISQAVTGVIGGLLAIYSLRAAAWATVGAFAIGWLVSLSLREPRRHQMHSERHFAAMWRITTNTLIHNVPLRSIVLLGGILSTLTLALVWYSQPYQELVGLPLMWFGLVHAVMMIAGALSSKFVHTAQRLMDDRILLALLAALIIGSFVGLGITTSLGGIVFLVLGRGTWGAFSPVVNDLVNRMTTSDVRATVLSVMSSFGRLISGLMLMLIGYGIEGQSLTQSILLTGIVSGAVLFLLFLMMRKVWNRIPS